MPPLPRPISGGLKGPARLWASLSRPAISPDTKQEDLEEHLAALNQDPAVHGVIVMQPLPAGFEEGKLAALLRPEKDVDCFNPINAGRVMADDSLAFPRPRPRRCWRS